MAKRTLNIKSLVPRKDSPYNQGYYHLINPSKYMGDPAKIIFRSAWEKRFATYCDINDRVISWSSEPLAIQYFHPVEKVMKPYNVDFYVKIDIGNGNFTEYIVEVKPQKQLQQPVNPSTSPNGRLTEKKLNGYYAQMKSYMINLAKFEAAKRYALNRGWQFVVVTEKFLFS